MKLLRFNFLPYLVCLHPKEINAVDLIAYWSVCCDLCTFAVLDFYYEYLPNSLFFRLGLGETVIDLHFMPTIIKDFKLVSLAVLQIFPLKDP